MAWDALDESILLSNSRDEPLSEIEQRNLELILKNAQITLPTQRNEQESTSYMSNENSSAMTYEQLKSEWGGNAIGPDMETDAEIARIYGLNEAVEEENEPRRWNPMTLFYE